MPESRTPRCFATRAMGSRFSVAFPASEKETDYHRQAARDVFQEIERLGKRLDHRLQGSDLFRVNRLKRGETTVVTPEVFRCLELAESVHRYTEGSFDVAWQMPLRERTRSIRPFRLLPDGLKIRAIRSPLRLDLDGIGKGFALDRTAALLREWDLTDLLLAADRSTLLAPRGGETRWPIRFEDTKTNKLSLALQDGAVSASGTSVRGAHIADPRRRTTFPLAWKRLWVRLDRTKAEHAFGDREIAAWADALSTALLVGNRRTIATWLARRPAVEVWALASPPGATLEKIAPAT